MRKCEHCIKKAKRYITIGWVEIPLCLPHYNEYRRKEKELKERTK